MNYTDLDLDVYNMVKDLPEENIVFYFRAGVDNVDDFFYAKGNLQDMGGTLAKLMEQNEDLELMVVHAVNEFQK